MTGSIVECGVYQGQKISYFLETLNKFKTNNIDPILLELAEKKKLKLKIKLKFLYFKLI